MFAPIQLAEELLNKAYENNPGRWREHSINVAASAQLIASAIKTRNPQKACFLGLIHDIGRINGITAFKHTIDGYNYMMQNNFDENAVICLTHLFPFQNILAYSGKLDCPEDVAIRHGINAYSIDKWKKLSN